MFRVIVTRAARRPVITAGTRLSRTYPLRWNSSQPPQAADPPPPTLKPLALEERKEAALERDDDLQRDLDAKSISYEELQPKTQSPLFVSQESNSMD
jgi:thiosulfate:glutathione sulfurtransferase